MSSDTAPSSQRRQPLVENADGPGQSATKRRKVRKGTRSCWECKRRKMKCVSNPPNSSVCNSCRRRGSKCVGQEYPDEATLYRAEPVGMDGGGFDPRFAVDQLVENAECNETSTTNPMPLPHNLVTSSAAKSMYYDPDILLRLTSSKSEECTRVLAMGCSY
jgi:hypothetical protein